MMAIIRPFNNDKLAMIQAKRKEKKRHTVYIMQRGYFGEWDCLVIPLEQKSLAFTYAT